MQKLVCPNCKSDTFMIGKLYHNAQAEYDEDTGEFTLIESADDEPIFAQVKCTSCNAQYNLQREEDLQSLTHPKTTCTQCGHEVSLNEVDENGVCIVCRSKLAHPELDHLNEMDEFDLVKLVATLKSENEELKLNMKQAALEEPKPKRKRRTKKEMEEARAAEEAAKQTEQVDIDEEQEDSDIEITEYDTAPEIPDALTEMASEQGGSDE